MSLLSPENAIWSQWVGPEASAIQNTMPNLFGEIIAIM